MVSARVQTPYGDIFAPSGPCKDDYPNLVQWTNAAGQTVKLQAPAIRALRAAELLNGRKRPWRRERKPKAIRITGQGWRSCESQEDLYRSDPGRYAPASSSLHCRGLAIDVENTRTNLTRRARRALQRCGWKFPLPDSEPWHASFHEAG